jgi:methylmalonyl-CoA mutase, N-terminal domain
VTKSVDPMGGSYYIEYLTARIEEEVEKYLRKIEKMGGAMAAIEKGFFQEEIRSNAYKLKKEIDEGKRIIVGVNKFQELHDMEPKLNIVDSETERQQVMKLKNFKNNRDTIKVNHQITNLLKAAQNDEENLMPLIISAVKNRVTLGEISNSLMQVFGRYEPKFSF